MKKLILLFLLASCTKDDPSKECETCTLDVEYIEYGSHSSNYVEKTVDNCDHAIKDGQVVSQGGWTNGGTHYYEKKVWHCK